MSPPHWQQSVERVRSSTIGRFIHVYGESQAGRYASGLAFSAFMTMFPLLLGVLSVIGFAIHNDSVRKQVESALLGVFPSDAHQGIEAALTGVRHSAGILGVLSLLGLIWAGTNLFAAMEFALNRIFGAKERDFVHQRLRGLGMIVVLVIAIVASVLANAAMDLLPYMAVLGPVSGALIMTVLIVLIYRFVPNHRFHLADIWPGALIAGVLIEIVTLSFPLYGRLVHGFNSYGAQFALFFLLASWIALLSQFILMGAIWNRIRMAAHTVAG